MQKQYQLLFIQNITYNKSATWAYKQNIDIDITIRLKYDGYQ